MDSFHDFLPGVSEVFGRSQSVKIGPHFFSSHTQAFGFLKAFFKHVYDGLGTSPGG